MSNEENYPAWICTQCAEDNHGKWPDLHLGTWHMDICDVCNKERAVTQPKDWGYPVITTYGEK